MTVQRKKSTALLRVILGDYRFYLAGIALLVFGLVLPEQFSITRIASWGLPCAQLQIGAILTFFTTLHYFCMLMQWCMQ